MSYKLFDIIPPKFNKASSEFIVTPKSKNQKRKTLKLSYLIISFIIIFFGGVYLFIKPSLEINIWPNLSKDNYSILVSVSTSTSDVDFKNLSIPASIITKEDEVVQKFSSSQMTVQNQARGYIRVYNHYSSDPITLVKNTRFMSSSGKIFLATSKFTIPPKPSYKDIEVIAAKAGEDYNIKPSFFSIPGLKGTALYTSVYGKSFQAMTGGYIGQIYQVTEKDLTQARERLLKLGFQKCEEEIEKSKPDDVITLDDTLNYSLDDFFPLAEKGQKVSSFMAKAKVKVRVLSFKKEDLDNLVQRYVRDKLPENQTIDPNYLNFSFHSVQSNGGNNIIKVDIRSRHYPQFKEDLLKQRIAGLKKVDISSSILDFYPYLTTPPQIKLFPFWAQRAPVDYSKIRINIHLNS